jgi:CRP-like cAMP-binding protein
VRQLELTERLLRLRGVPVFRPLPAGDLAQIAESIRPRTFERGDVLLREDEPPKSFYLLSTGTVTMRRKGKRIGTIRAPGGVGFLSALARNVGSTEAVAENYTEGYEVRTDVLDEIFEDHFPVLLGALRWVAERLIVENQQQKPPPYVPPEVPFQHLIGDHELGIVERIFLLRRTRGFARANVNSLARLARGMQEVRKGPNEVLWRPGEKADYSYFVVKGMLSLSWNEGASTQIVGPGYVLGGAESLLRFERWNELTTTEPVVLLRGSREGLLDMFEDDHEMGRQFLSLLATFLMTLWDRKAEAGITSVGSRGPSEHMPAADKAEETEAAAASPP